MREFNWQNYVLWYGACAFLVYEVLLWKAKRAETTRTFASQNIAGVRIWFLLWVVGTCLTPGWRWCGVAILSATLYDIGKYVLDLYDPFEEYPFDGKVAAIVLILAVVFRIP